MELIVCGSSSSGNGYILHNEKEALIIECGMPFESIQKALGYNTRKIVGALVSHRHNDHAGYIKQYAKRGVVVHTCADVLSVQDRLTRCFCRVLEEQHLYGIGDFRVYPLPVTHDVDCFAFVISHPETGAILFATDTCGFKFKVPNLQHIMIECNYADDILEENIEKGLVIPAQRTRLLQTHLELKTTKRIISRLQGEKLKEVIIIHLSSGNADSVRFSTEIQRDTGLPTYVAEPNMKLTL